MACAKDKIGRNGVDWNSSHPEFVPRLLDCSGSQPGVNGLRKELLNFVLYKILHTKNEGIIDTLSDRDDEFKGKYVELWNNLHLVDVRKILSDVLIILGGEKITDIELKFDLVANINLENSIVIHCKEALIYTVLHNLSWAGNLISLSIKNLSDYDPRCKCHVIRTVAENCHRLQYLNIEPLEQPNYDEDNLVESMRWLYGDYAKQDVVKGCPKLKTLILPEYWSLPSAVDHGLKMLHYMPDLCTLRNVDTRAIVEKYIKETPNPQPLKLVELEEWSIDYSEDFKQLDYTVDFNKLAEVLPNLNTFNSFVGGILTTDYNELKKITSFWELRTLVLHFDDGGWIFNEKFQDIGSVPTLKNLTIRVIPEELDLSQIEILSKRFPNLQKLTLKSCGFFDYLDSNDKQDMILFPELISLKLTHFSEMDPEFLSSFLECCPKLIDLDMWSQSSDDLLEDNPMCCEFLCKLLPKMKNLEKLSISRKYGKELLKLNKEIAKQLILECHNLKWLGCLGSWDVSEEDLCQLLKWSREQNFDVHISYLQTDLPHLTIPRKPWETTAARFF